MGISFLTPEHLALAWTVVALLTAILVGVGWRAAARASTRAEYKELIRHFAGETMVRASAEEVARNLMGWLLGLLMPPKMREVVEMRLSMAGYSGSRPLLRFQLAKLAGLVGGVTGAALGLSAGIMPVGFAVTMVVLLFYGPDLWLARQIASRTRKIGFQLPEALDLLQLCVRAGLGFTSGLQEVARIQRGPVAAEFSRVLQEMQFGMSRIDAFSALAERTKQPDLIRFSHAMVRADQAGITVSDMLAEQARSMREARQSLAREKAQQVSVKILFPLLICFLPGVFLIVLGPAALNLMSIFR